MHCPLKYSTSRLSDPAGLSLFQHRKPHRRRCLSRQIRQPSQQIPAPSQQRHSRGLVVQCCRDDSAHSHPGRHPDAAHGQVRGAENSLVHLLLTKQQENAIKRMLAGTSREQDTTDDGKQQQCTAVCCCCCSCFSIVSLSPSPESNSYLLHPCQDCLVTLILLALCA